MNSKAFPLLFTFLALALNSMSFGAVFPTRVENLDSSSFPNIQAAVNVFSEKPIKRLTKDDFKVTEDGQPIRNFSVEVDSRPVYMVLLLDRSGSMHNSMPHLKKAACQFISMLNDDTFCQVMSFSSEVRRHTSFSNNSTYLKKRVAALEAHGATALYDAIKDACRGLRHYPENYRKIVVTFTDGKDQNAHGTGPQSTASAKDAVKYARRVGASLYYIGLGNEISKGLLTKMAYYTGGKFLHSLDRQELADIFQEMAKTLNQTYHLSYKSPNPSRNGSIRKIQVHSKLSGTTDQGKGKYRAPRDPKPADIAKAYAAAPKLPKSPKSSPRRKVAKTPKGQYGEAKLRYVLGNLFASPKFGTKIDTEINNWTKVENKRHPVKTSMDLKFDCSTSTNIRQQVDVTSGVNVSAGNVSVVTEGDKCHVRVGDDINVRVDANKVAVKAPGLKALTPTGVVGTVLPFKAFKGVKSHTDVNNIVSVVSQYGDIEVTGPGVIHIRAKNTADPSCRIFFDRKTGLPQTLVSYSPKGAVKTTRYRGWVKDVDIKVPQVKVNTKVDVTAACKLAERITGPILADTEELVDACEKLGAASVLLAQQNVEMALRTVETFDKHFVANMKQFDTNMVQFQQNLETNLATDMAQFEKQMEQFGKNMEQFGENMGKMGEDMGRMGEDMGRMGEDMGRAGEDLGRNMQNLGDTLEKNLGGLGNLGW